MAKQTYKELSDELSRVMSELERGDLDIDEAVRCYERGLAIVKELEVHLKNAENKVVQLKAKTLDEIEEE
ncbi:MAG: Exonuclease small subunit [Candidatus Saccharibacteria bacterium]|nr:Exonuclease small subunit [Candidatus Saccharibacteria bacterium]